MGRLLLASNTRLDREVRGVHRGINRLKKGAKGFAISGDTSEALTAQDLC
jgi:hypothetical protein